MDAHVLNLVDKYHVSSPFTPIKIRASTKREFAKIFHEICKFFKSFNVKIIKSKRFFIIHHNFESK